MSVLVLPDTTAAAVKVVKTTTLNMDTATMAARIYTSEQDS